MDYGHVFLGKGFLLIPITIISTFLTLWLSGVTSQYIAKRKEQSIMQIILLTFLFTIGTVVIYLVMNFFYFKYHRAFLLPIMTSSIAIILILMLFNVPYEMYMNGGKWIDMILGPAIVSLAIPLYKQRELLKQNLVPVISGIVVGVITGMLSGVTFARLFGFSKEVVPHFTT